MSEIQLNCPCGCAGITFLTVSVPTGMTAEAVRQAWKDDVVDGGHTFSCASCSCTYATKDDGTDVSQGGTITAGTDLSKPRADSISGNTSGTTSGGTSVTLNGHSFNTDTPVVKVDGISATGISVTNDNELSFDTPAGLIKLAISEYHTKLSHGTVTSGPFQVGETVTGGTSSATGVVTQEVTDDYLMVKTVSGTFQNGEVLTGDTSGATATTDAAPTIPNFSTSETITGQTSSVTSTAQEVGTLKVNTLSGSYTAGEEILGGTSAARATLDGTTPMDGFVDVTVSNTNGQQTERIVHGTVTSGPFVRGEIITGGTSGTTAIVYSVALDNLSMIVEHTDGAFTGSETLTGGTSGATASFTSLTGGRLARAFEYTP